MSVRQSFSRVGILPRDLKDLTRGQALWNASVPVVSVVPLLQHREGDPAACLVAPGDVVREGMIIGRAAGPEGAHVHSPVPGTVRELREVFLPDGRRSPAVVIELGGEFDRLGKSVRKYPWENHSQKDLLGIIADKGVVGMESAVPTHLKYTIPKNRRVDLFILNCSECEPYLTANHRLMLEKAPQIVEGARIVAKILDPRRILIAVDKSRKDALDALGQAAKAAEFGAEIAMVGSWFPQGDEKQMIRTLTGLEVPSGGEALDVGAVVSNVGTVFAVYEAVALLKPVIEKALTVAGGAIRNPGNLKVRIGTPLTDLVEECGGFVEMPEKIVIGGPMTGSAIFDLSTPVTKNTTGVLFLTSREIRNSRRTNCLRCGRCVEACPMGLDPTNLFKLIDHGAYGEAFGQGLKDCRECGCCAYVCPARIPLVQGLRVGKAVSLERGGAA